MTGKPSTISPSCASRRGKTPRHADAIRQPDRPTRQRSIDAPIQRLKAGSKAPGSTLVVLLLLIAWLITACVPQTQPQTSPDMPTAMPTQQSTGRGAGGKLKILNPQAPVTLNPHLSASVKDLEPTRIVYEPLASFDQNGKLVPILASEIPSIENGEVASDGKSVTWKLKQGVKWSDGEPFTADDVLFTYKYATNPDVKAATASAFADVTSVEVVDNYTVKVSFKDANPAWYLPFVGNRGLILPRHIFEPFNGTYAQEAPANTHPIGTGPYKVWDQGIKTQEVLLLGSQLVETNKIVFELNENYRQPDKPYFSQIEWRGGGTQDEAARQVQSGEVDYAYGLGQLSPDLLSKMTQDKQLITNFGSNVYRILLNHTDPNQETTDGERSNLKFEHPFFNDPKVRQAFAYAIDRQTLAELYGPVGRPTSNNLVAPPQYNSPNTFYEYDLQKAKDLLGEAGWKDTDRDGILDKDGTKMKVVFQAENGPALIQAQKIVKKDLESLGIEVELKNEDPSILFGPCASNPNSAFCFNADLIYLWIRSSSPDPKGYMRFWTCAQIPQKANNWSGLNIERWCNDEYEKLFQQASTELDPKKREQLFIQMNDLIIKDVAMIPTVFFADAQGINPDLADVVLTPWDNNTWNIENWRLVSK